MVSPAIDVSELVVVRGGREALDAVSLTAATCRVTGLLGPSGHASQGQGLDLWQIRVVRRENPDAGAEPAA